MKTSLEGGGGVMESAMTVCGISLPEASSLTHTEMLADSPGRKECRRHSRIQDVAKQKVKSPRPNVNEAVEPVGCRYALDVMNYVHVSRVQLIGVRVNESDCSIDASPNLIPFIGLLAGYCDRHFPPEDLRCVA